MGICELNDNIRKLYLFAIFWGFGYAALTFSWLVIYIGFPAWFDETLCHTYVIAKQYNLDDYADDSSDDDDDDDDDDTDDDDDDNHSYHNAGFFLLTSFHTNSATSKQTWGLR